MLRWQEALDPNTDNKDFTVDYSLWLQTSETIIASVWTAPDGIVASTPTISGDGKKVTVWLSGGIAGRYETIVNKVTTSLARVETKSILLYVGPN